MKQITYYKDTMPWSYKPILSSHNETIDAIQRGDININTYAISTLDFSYLIDLGYNIKLCENNKIFEIKEGVVEATDKEIRKTHDIRRMWIGGSFNNFFYGK